MDTHKFIVIEIQRFEGGGISTPAYAYNDQNAAESKYYSIMASAAVSKLPVHSAILINEYGGLIMNGSYTHEEPEE